MTRSSPLDGEGVVAPHGPRARIAERFSAALVLGGLLFAFSTACTRTESSAAGGGDETTAVVNIAIIRSDTLRESLTAYGTVVPAPGSARVFTAPFEGIVSRLHVSRGQRVDAGQRLADITPSPEARLLFESARAAVTTARGRMSDVQQRLRLGLTTRDELLQQEQVLADAEARWKAYAGWLDGLRLTAGAGGVVDRLPVSEGQRIPAGDMVVSVVSGARFEVALGVEPEDASLIVPGQRVRIERRAAEGVVDTIDGRVRSVSLAVDSATRLTSALVVPDDRSHALMLGEYVQALVAVRGAEGLVVPRSALLSQQDGMALFVVRDGRAYRRTVRVGVDTDSLAQVTGDGLQVGDTIVVLGGYELSDSMRVRTSATRAARSDTVSPTATAK